MQASLPREMDSLEIFGGNKGHPKPKGFSGGGSSDEIGRDGSREGDEMGEGRRGIQWSNLLLFRVPAPPSAAAGSGGGGWLAALVKKNSSLFFRNNQ